MGQKVRTEDGLNELPVWLPESAFHYLVHTETGASIRALARDAGCHASTILRQIRSFETRRDDLLIDQALRRLGRKFYGAKNTGSPYTESTMNALHKVEIETEADTLSETRLRQESRRILRNLCETGAVLAVAAEMDKAVVVRETDDGQSVRSGIVDREIAEAMALKDWIACDAPGRIARYHITRAGRAALNAMLTDAENKAMGFNDAQAPFDGAAKPVEMADDADASAERSKRVRYNMAETPLSALARRKDRDGQPFLPNDLVRAGERLREDFELAQMGPRKENNWDKFLTNTERAIAPLDGSARGAEAARARVTGALRELGPGLGDVALRCCCYLEGLERAEKRMGWSARSGKIVLRIALQRLKRHYEELGDAGGLIG
ncbi:DUF6456 domain-containing protein [Roseovarius aestuarii]|uniref:DUF6456 domain-containing protein n=1 Tax=Roseovarius aestuarii TaxID=475083 RepID=A0A1X7BNK4_9RHOB|nr:DUF6456 domain-containing protein [Roseovarius aestuarii]SMC11192.1 hypothetical protein ROA7745_01003 [Roseovarius aestuarii]